MRKAIIWTNDDLDYWRLYVLFALKVLTHMFRLIWKSPHPTDIQNWFTCTDIVVLWDKYHLNVPIG